MSDKKIKLGGVLIKPKVIKVIYIIKKHTKSSKVKENMHRIKKKLQQKAQNIKNIKPYGVLAADVEADGETDGDRVD